MKVIDVKPNEETMAHFWGGKTRVNLYIEIVGDCRLRTETRTASGEQGAHYCTAMPLHEGVYPWACTAGICPRIVEEDIAIGSCRKRRDEERSAAVEAANKHGKEKGGE